MKELYILFLAVAMVASFHLEAGKADIAININEPKKDIDMPHYANITLILTLVIVFLMCIMKTFCIFWAWLFPNDQKDPVPEQVYQEHVKPKGRARGRALSEGGEM